MLNVALQKFEYARCDARSGRDGGSHARRHLGGGYLATSKDRTRIMKRRWCRKYWSRDPGSGIRYLKEPATRFQVLRIQTPHRDSASEHQRRRHTASLLRSSKTVRAARTNQIRLAHPFVSCAELDESGASPPPCLS